ncbi:MAG: HD domain-containing phosphohydrolase [Gemmatimonadales bacterium]
MVDDEAPNRLLLRDLLEARGHEVTEAANGLAALESARAVPPDVVLLDVMMPGLDGLEVCRRLKADAATAPIPVLLVTALDARADRLAGMRAGANDFLTKPVDLADLALRVRNAVITRRLFGQVEAMRAVLEENNAMLEKRVSERTRELEESQLEVLERLCGAAEFRDDDTRKHTRRVAIIADALAANLGMDGRTCDLLRRAAPLHDVGKIAIPDRVLLKPGPLTTEEFDTMKTHTTVGAQILGRGRSELMRMAEEIALCHHERWDGTGYPNGLRGEAIPLVARVMAVADVFDALTHDRPYRKAWPVEDVIDVVARQSGIHFDPRVAHAFLELGSHERFLSLPEQDAP